MLDAIIKGFRSAKQTLSTGTITDQALNGALRDIRLALLEGDVDLSVTRSFLDRVRSRAAGEVMGGVAQLETKDGVKKITPYHQFVAICQEELENLMGPAEPELVLSPMGVTAVMMVGLQGAGKTTTSAKLAHWLKARDGKRPMLVAADVRRPAAIEQLETLGAQIEVPVHAERGTDPLALCGNALAQASKRKRDVVIFDTAGRLAIDQELMDELCQIKDRTKPQEILLVVDAMIGQDAVKTAEAFNEALGLTGFVMTKLDGDARGGSALSIKEITGKPIKFLGMGEGIDALEKFRPEGLASRILGMGDVVGLVKEFERHVDQDKAEADAERMFRGQFDMGDFVEQIGVLKQMGSLQDLMEKMPVFQEGQMPEGFRPDEREFTKIISVHDSMTPLERRRPALVRDPSRLKRIALGSGRTEAHVMEVLNKFDTMRRMMIALGDQPSLLTKLPGFGTVAQVRKLRGLDLTELFGEGFEPPPEPEPDDIPLDSIEVSPKKREYFADLAKPVSAPKKQDKNKTKRKRQMAKKAKRRNRR